MDELSKYQKVINVDQQKSHELLGIGGLKRSRLRLQNSPHVWLGDHLIQNQPSMVFSWNLELGQLIISEIGPEAWALFVAIERHDGIGLCKSSHYQNWGRLDIRPLWWRRMSAA